MPCVGMALAAIIAIQDRARWILVAFAGLLGLGLSLSGVWFVTWRRQLILDRGSGTACLTSGGLGITSRSAVRLHDIRLIVRPVRVREHRPRAGRSFFPFALTAQVGDKVMVLARGVDSAPIEELARRISDATTVEIEREATPLESRV